MPHDQQAIQQTKRNRWDDEQIHRRDAVGMIVEKCFPALGRRPSTLGHILGYARLTDIDAELEKFAVDAWRSPEWICDAHFPDELACFQWYRRPATMASRLPAPVQPETQEPSSHDSIARFSVNRQPDEVCDRDTRYLFPSRLHARPHISTRQYARLVHRWVESIGLESASYGTHSMRRTKAAQIYRNTGNLRAVQLLLGTTTYCPRTTG